MSQLVRGLRDTSELPGRPASGSGNMAVYRHILVLPPPPESLPPKNENPPTAEILSPYCITAETLPR